MEISRGTYLFYFDYSSDMVDYYEYDLGQWLLRIDYSLLGRYDAYFEGDRSAYIEAREIVINQSIYKFLGSKFISGMYKGLSLIITEDYLSSSLEQVLKYFDLDIEKIKEETDQKEIWPKYLPSPIIEKKLEQSYKELKEGKADETKFKIMLIDLLYFIKTYPDQASSQIAYYPKDDKEKGKASIQWALDQDKLYLISLEDLLRQSGLSRSTYYALFVSIYGESPIQFLKGIILNKAANSLATGKVSVGQIAQASGYSNFSKFSSAFKKRYKMTPSQWIKEKTKLP